MKAGAAGRIDIVLKIIDTYSYDYVTCFAGCSTLWNMSYANASTQKEVCKKGDLTVLLIILKEYSDKLDVSETYCAAIGTVFSSPKVHFKYCTPEVIRAVEECYEKHKDSEQIKQFLLSLKREEDPRVCDAVARGVCTKEAFPKCSEKCQCDKGGYCPKCCMQQKVFGCLTCDKGEIKLYCEVCWKRDHQGHNGEEFFCPARCATGHK